jgi:hypothetical protein
MINMSKIKPDRGASASKTGRKISGDRAISIPRRTRIRLGRTGW